MARLDGRVIVFFLQAEDGIRDFHVTGVQTCALPTLVAILLGVVAVLLQAAGPRILGWATDRIFEGLLGRQMPAGASQAEVVEQLRAQGEDRVADMVGSMENLVPGQGVDFDAVARSEEHTSELQSR